MYLCISWIVIALLSWDNFIRWIDKRIKGDVYCKFGNGDVEAVWWILQLCNGVHHFLVKLYNYCKSRILEKGFLSNQWLSLLLCVVLHWVWSLLPGKKLCYRNKQGRNSCQNTRRICPMWITGYGEECIRIAKTEGDIECEEQNLHVPIWNKENN